MSKKSKKADSIGNPSTIANAMYDAQKKEITSSMVLSLSFIAAGLIVAAIGIFQYFHIKGNMVDSSESIDAMAWLVIAGVGLLVGIIGLVSIMKSVVSLGQIGSWAKEAESHASPFQAQKLHRKVAAMNQAQSMKKPDSQGAAERESDQKPKFGFFKRGRENKGKQNNEDLYYKYNPQEKQQAKPPEKAAPMMEQKFDYGIEETKKLTFADEFLKKNKRDPFAQYRKDLGIEEEPKKEVKKKPKFIINATANENADTASTERMQTSQADIPTVPLNLQGSAPTESQPIMHNAEMTAATQSSGLDLMFSSPAEEAAPSGKSINDSSNVLDFAQDQPNLNAASKAAPIHFEETSVMNGSPYGMRNDSDDDIFFSAKTVTPPTQQTQIQTQPLKQPQKITPNLSALDNAIPTAAASPTVVLDLDYKKKHSPEDYDFSLFEEIDPNKANKQNIQQTSVKSQPVVQQAQTSQQAYNTLNDDMFFGGGAATQKAPEPTDTQQNFMSNFVSNIEDQEAYSIPTQQPAQQAATPPQQVQQPIQQPIQQTSQQQPIVQQQPVRQQKAPFTNKKKNAPKTSTPPKSKNTKKKGKKSFSEMFLNNHGKSANNDSDTDSEIVKNGTKAQRKFVDASEYDEWTCPECGKVNQEYVGLCACGTRKPRAKR